MWALTNPTCIVTNPNNNHTVLLPSVQTFEIKEVTRMISRNPLGFSFLLTQFISNHEVYFCFHFLFPFPSQHLLWFDATLCES